MLGIAKNRYAIATDFEVRYVRHSEDTRYSGRVGNAVAALTITKNGAQQGQPNLKETAKLLKNWE